MALCALQYQTWKSSRHDRTHQIEVFLLFLLGTYSLISDLSHGIETPIRDTDIFQHPEKVLQEDSCVYIVCDTMDFEFNELGEEVEKAFREGRSDLESEIYGTSISQFLPL